MNIAVPIAVRFRSKLNTTIKNTMNSIKQTIKAALRSFTFTSFLIDSSVSGLSAKYLIKIKLKNYLFLCDEELVNQ